MEKDISRIILTRKDSQRKLKVKHVDFIKAFLENEKDYTFTLRDLEEKLLLKFSDLENISRVTLGRLLKQLGYSYKKIYGYPEKRMISFCIVNF